MAPLAKRSALAALTLIGLVLVVVGLWFTSHLGSSGSGTFTARPSADGVVVLGPEVLNRIDRPVQISARAKDGGEVWIGRSAPFDAKALVGQAARTTVDGVAVGGWELTTTKSAGGQAPALASADVWRQQVTAKGTGRMTVTQGSAPESVVIATGAGKPSSLDEVTLTWQNRTWFFQALVTALIGLLLAAAGAGGLWQMRARPGRHEAGSHGARTGHKAGTGHEAGTGNEGRSVAPGRERDTQVDESREATP